MSAIEPAVTPWNGEVLLFFMENRFAEVQSEIELMLSQVMAYVMRDPVFTSNQLPGRFVLVSVFREHWAQVLSAEQRAFLRRHCEAVYISRGFPPSEDDLPSSVG
jgi:hypothetical protein